MRRYFIIFPLAAFCLYDMLCVRRNDFSRNREAKFINKPVEAIIGSLISKRIIKHNQNHIYKQDTEEVKLVKRAMARLIEANNLKDYIIPTKSGEVEVTLVHNDTVIMFMNLDQRLFLTIPILKFAGMQEERVALLIAHELAHYLLDH